MRISDWKFRRVLFRSVEDEGIALRPGDADVGFGVEFQAHRATMAKLAVDDIAGAGPAFRFLEQRMIDDDPELVIGKVDRLVVFIPTLPRIGADQDDPANLARPGCLHSIEIEAGAQYTRDALDLLLLEIGRASCRVRVCQKG